jgi:hypothetical protein
MNLIDMDVERLRLELWEAKHEMEITRTTNPFSYAEGGMGRAYGYDPPKREATASPLPSGDKDNE